MDKITLPPYIQGMTNEPLPAALTELMAPYTRELRAVPFLRRARAGTMGLPMWLRWARERYRIAQYFIPLCQAIVTAARDTLHDETIAAVVEDNIRDEKGLNDPAAGSHESWRLDFYRALGADAADAPPLLDGTRMFSETAAQLQAAGDAFYMIGALWFLEATIPHEYTFLLTGLEIEFPEIFSVADGMTPEKFRARRYLDDHIYHDAAHHAKDLYLALARYADDAGVLARLRHGCDAMLAAKQKFYADLEMIAQKATAQAA